MQENKISKEPVQQLETDIVKAVTIDCVVFGFDNDDLEVLLVKHTDGIRKGEWALPGGWILKNEPINDAAYRLLEQLTGVKNIYLEQLQAFGEPDRYPLRRVITIGYYALIKKAAFSITPDSAKWFKIDAVPELIYDHSTILKFSLKNLRRLVRLEPIGFNLLPEKFTLLQLMKLYEAILNIEMDKSNFRRKFQRMNLLTPLNEKQSDVSHRAAQLYSFNLKVYNALTENGFSFEF